MRGSEKTTPTSTMQKRTIDLTMPVTHLKGGERGRAKVRDGASEGARRHEKARDRLDVAGHAREQDLHEVPPVPLTRTMCSNRLRVWCTPHGRHWDLSTSQRRGRSGSRTP